jgi:hypothetical protein
MNLGNRSMADIQDYIASQRHIIAGADEARRHLCFALDYIAEQTEVRKVASCQDFIERGDWLQKWCCLDCHRLAAEQGDHIALAQCDLGNLRRPSLLCCHAAILLDPRRMPSHELDYETD